MKLINPSEHTHDPKYYNRDSDILTALTWNAIKKSLIEAGREELYSAIKSVHVWEKYITIATYKPVINAEIKLIAKDILKKINESFQSYNGIQRIGIRGK